MCNRVTLSESKNCRGHSPLIETVSCCGLLHEGVVTMVVSSSPCACDGANEHRVECIPLPMPFTNEHLVPMPFTRVLGFGLGVAFKQLECPSSAFPDLKVSLRTDAVALELLSWTQRVKGGCNLLYFYTHWPITGADSTATGGFNHHQNLPHTHSGQCPRGQATRRPSALVAGQGQDVAFVSSHVLPLALHHQHLHH